MQKIAYWYWREFLKRSDAYARCCAAGGRGLLAVTYEHFGDVFSVEFDEWWKLGKLRFEVEPEFLVNVVRTHSEFTALFVEDAEDLLGLVVNLNAPVKSVLQAIEKLLRARGPVDSEENSTVKRKRGRPAVDTSLYHTLGVSRMLTAQDTHAMEIMLKVFDMCAAEDKKPLPQRMRRHEIGRLLGLDVAEPSSDSLDRSEENRLVTVKVSNYYRKAKALIANAEMGFFPSYRGI